MFLPRGKLNPMKDPLRAPSLFIAFGLLAGLTFQPPPGVGTAVYGVMVLLGAGVVWGTAAPSASPSSRPLALALGGAVGMAAVAWFLQRPVFPSALLLALVLFLGRHPFLPLPERPSFALLADLASGFLLCLVAAGAPGTLPVQVGAGHLALAYGGLLLYAGGPAGKWMLGLACWLGFHLIGVGMVGMKFYPLMAFLPFFLGAGTALYFLLTRQEPTTRTVRACRGILALLGVLLLIDRFVRP